jgi:hypothetical protein
MEREDISKTGDKKPDGQPIDGFAGGDLNLLGPDSQVVQQIGSEDSVCCCFTGPRGSGKTLSLSYFGCIDLAKGKRVWSNYPIEFGFWHHAPDGRVWPQVYKSLPLDMESLILFDKGIAEGVVLLDELNLWLDSRASLSVFNKLISKLFTMIRHRKLSVYMSTQDLRWLDRRIQFQVDAHCACTDLSYKYKALPRGVWIAQVWRDLSGLFTGTSFYDSGREFHTTFRGDGFWRCYSSWTEFNPFDIDTNYRIKKKTRDIIIGRTAEEDFQEATAVVSEIVSRYAHSGVAQVRAEDLQAEAKIAGLDMATRELGKVFRAAGLEYHQTRKGNFYNIPGETT